MENVRSARSEKTGERQAPPEVCAGCFYRRQSLERATHRLMEARCVLFLEEVPAESFDFLEDVEVWKISLEFLNEESVGICEERISREVIFKVVEDFLNGVVEADDGLRMVVIHERAPLD